MKAAESQGLSSQAVAALFSAAYEEGQNISDPAVLQLVRLVTVSRHCCYMHR